MLTELGLRNFKAFGDIEQKAPLSKINLIYGPNSSGKSSIIQALLMLKQQPSPTSNGGERTLAANGDFTNLGSYLALLHKHDLDRQLSIRCRFARSVSSRFKYEADVLFDRYQNNAELGVISEVVYRISSNSQDFEPVQIKCDFDVENNFWNITDQFRGAIASELVVIDRGPRGRFYLPTPFPPPKDTDYQERPEASHRLSMSRESGRRRHENAPPIEGNLNLELIRQEQLSLLTRRFTTFPRHFNDQLAAIKYLEPLRSRPERLYQANVVNNEKATGGMDAIRLLHESPTLLRVVNEWFKEFEISIEIATKSVRDSILGGEYFVLVMIDKNTNTPITIADVGFGINQVLPIVIEGVALSESSPLGGVLCVEQPEIHIHPKLQAHLADLMIDTTRGLRNSNQWIVETHSELLILRLQRRIREKKLYPGDVTVLYVAPQGIDGSVIQQLRLDEDGNFIDDWPSGFFEEGFNELMA